MAALVAIGLGFGLVVPKVAGAAFLLLAAIAIVWLEPAVVRRRAEPVLVPGDGPLVLAVIGFVSLWLAAWALHGLGPIGTDDVGRTLRLLLIVPLYLFLRRVDGLDRPLWWGLALGALVAGVFAIGTTLDGQAGPWQSRVGGATNPIYFGGVSLAFALALLPRVASASIPPAERTIAALALLLGMLAAALSGSRGAWLALPPLLLVYAFTLAGGQRPIRRFGWPIAVAALTLVLALIPGVPLGDRVAEAIAGLDRPAGAELDPWNTLAVRSELWRVAFDSIAAHPFLGGGPGAFRQALEAAAAGGGLHPQLLRYEHPHSQYLSALTINGPLGLLALLALFGVPLALAARALADPAREVRHLAWAAVAMVTVLAVVALGESIFQRNAGIVWFGLLVALGLARVRSTERLAAAPIRAD
ncbi:O-antigen ligase family protein [Halomonas denitrificans]|nr:O-antigen ligase family protein [Halomonas denitrificans]